MPRSTSPNESRRSAHKRRSPSPRRDNDSRRKRRRSSTRSDSSSRPQYRSRRFPSPSTHKRSSRSRERRTHSNRDRSPDRRRGDSPAGRRMKDTRGSPMSLSRSRSRSPPRRRSRDRRRRDNSADRSKDAYTKTHSRSRSRTRTRRSRDRSRSRSPRRNHSRSRSPPRRPHRRDPPSDEPIRRRGPLPDQQSAFTIELQQGEGGTDVAPPVEKQKPNFSNTGLLAKEANKVAGTSISLKYHEPPEARKPPASAAWSLLVFKGNEHLQTIPLHERSCWLIGRESKVADIIVEHPSCSGQHAVIQFRYIEKKTSMGDKKGKVRPYLIDLESRNKTLLDGEAIDGGRYVELRTGDVVKFGESTREYVLMLPPKE